MQKVKLKDLKRISFSDAWAYQTSLLNELIANKRQAASEGDDQYQPAHELIICEHEPVYTLGKSGKLDHLLLTEVELAQNGFEFFKINRGGDITYHGPGQLVVYPVFDLDYFFNDLHRYVRLLEEAVIQVLQAFDIKGYRIPGYTGVWLDGADGVTKKICAIGVHLSRWVSMHGLAFNVNTDLSHFDYIVPCGIDDQDKAVTSLQAELGRAVDMELVKRQMAATFQELFGYEYH